jgi:hypothetical protein
MKALLAMVMFAATIALAAAGETVEFGPFDAIHVDRDAVEDVQVDGDAIYVKVAPKLRQAEFTVKISNSKSAGYRAWGSGGNEMTVKVYQSRQKNRLGFTYRITTGARFVEYWTDGKLVLHLERVR